MKKGYILSLVAIILITLIAYVVWNINKKNSLSGSDKDSFIPYNSAIVIKKNSQIGLSGDLAKIKLSWQQTQHATLLDTAITILIQKNYIDSTSRVQALRVEARDKIATLQVSLNKGIKSQGEIVEILRTAFKDNEQQMRKYDGYRLYTLKRGKDEIYLVLADETILLSDSELYIEDALKQHEAEKENKEKTTYSNINKYFSASANLNIFLNTGWFTEILPFYLDIRQISSNLDITQWLKWGALDGEYTDKGLFFNGFIHYVGMEQSYFKTLAGQQPKESTIDAIVPTKAHAFLSLNISNLNAYFSALEQYRYNAELKDKTNNRKQYYTKNLGMDAEPGLKELLQGEFAIVTTAYDKIKKEKDGLIIAQLKSGGLCVSLIEKMLSGNARIVNVHPDSYRKTYSIDRDKSFTYYRFPMDDFPAVYWGYIFDSIKSRYVFVVDNYLVFASSEESVKNFLRDYVHRTSIKDTEWYRNIRNGLSAKYNIAYFAEIESALPAYQNATKGTLNDYLLSSESQAGLFSGVGIECSNEDGMLYTTLLLSTEKVLGNERPHILWQTKLDAKMSMKPVPVQNHTTGEQELFIQDENNTIYLVNDAGRILWKTPVDGKINSEVYQIDILKNGKLQYLFSTATKIYLMDRNGNHVDRFPVTLKAPTTMGISVFDYDKDKNYRIFVPCTDREIYLYGTDGNIVSGWTPAKSDKEIVSKVSFYRIADKDYITFADQYRFYILDRKGNERIRVSAVFDLAANTDTYLTKKNGTPVLAFADALGIVNMVGFDGKVSTITCGKPAPGFLMNIGDTDRDAKDDFLFTDRNKLTIYNQDGKLLVEKELDARSLDFPYLYRFSSSDNRIGLLDREKQQMILLDTKGDISKGFPITGDSPFSITFSGDGAFYLFAGAGNGTLIKYRVQR